MDKVRAHHLYFARIGLTVWNGGMEMENERKYPAAYLPLSTLLTAFDHLKAISIPNKIESRTFPSMSSQSTSQLLSALKFFDLIEDDGIPQPLLYDLVQKPDERKALIRQLIELYYPDIVEKDFSKITVTELDTALAGKRYNVQGDTRKKAKTFLLKAAQYAGFTVHPLLTKVTRTRSRAGGRRAGAATNSAASAGANGSADAAPPTPAPHQDEPTGSQKTIQLRRGGSLTLSYSVNLWDLKGEDRQFVFDLIDKIDAYEEGSKGSDADVLKLGKDNVS